LIHSKLLQDRQAVDQALKEGCQVQIKEAFITLKKLLTTAPVLAQPDIEKSFDVYCDASDMDIRGILMQDGRAITYASQQLR
jgi:hypothetical protein